LNLAFDCRIDETAARQEPEALPGWVHPWLEFPPSLRRCEKNAKTGSIAENTPRFSWGL
jgi:hypothetical protein